MWQDVVNACFELVGGALVFLNCHRLYKDKEVKGVNWQVIAFFTIWGYWNIIFYPSIGAWFSFVGGLLLALGNTFWITLYIYYTYYGNMETK